MPDRTDLTSFRDLIHDHLDIVLADGQSYLFEVIRRFCLIQCRRAIALPAPREELVERVLYEHLRELGELFEKIAAAAFEKNFTEQALNDMMVAWLREYLDRKRGA